MKYFSVFLILLLSLLGFPSGNGRIFTLEMHHRFSEPVKKWSEAARNYFPAGNWPVRGSFEYYAQLAGHDRLLRGRRISESDAPLTFSDGNSTFRINSLGFLHYTTVTLGTPGLKFLVALDTGSDLFWVPCDCSKCAPTEGTPYSSVCPSIVVASCGDLLGYWRSFLLFNFHRWALESWHLAMRKCRNGHNRYKGLV